MNHTETFNEIMKRSTPAKREKQQPVKVRLIGKRDNMNAMQTDLSKCIISGNTVSLPFEQLPNYQEVRKALLNAGATYSRSKFIFPNDAQPYIDRLMGGESVNIKKEFQAFFTPSGLAKYLVSLARPQFGESILEPSAGQGALINAIMEKRGNGAPVYYCEIMDVNLSILEKITDTVLLEKDFLELQQNQNMLFSCIIANPPFNKNQDIDHIRKMYDVCKPGGRIVTIASKHWQFVKNKKETAFREWLEEINADIQEIPAEAFKESGTNIATCIIIINK